jgi:LysM repeat protein
MAVSPRLIAFGALCASPALFLTGCGDDATGARTTLGTVQNTSYVVEPPITTTTTTTLPTAVAPGQTVPGEQSYTVVAGDSVYKIASLHGIAPDALANYNDWPEGIAHNLLPGDVVRIPPGSQAPSASGSGSGSTGGDTGTSDGETPATPTTAAADAGTGCTHTVVANDNPTRVANQYDVTLDELNNANVGNPAYTRFLIGDSINIPPNGNC